MKNQINREPNLTGERFEFFHIKVTDFQALGNDIEELFAQEQLYNLTVFFKIERLWRPRK